MVGSAVVGGGGTALYPPAPASTSPPPGVLSPVATVRHSRHHAVRGWQHRSVDDDALLAEQRAYYRARAPEYDTWWQRTGRYDRGDEMAVEWQRQVSAVEDALARFDARGDVLELAGGTGWWTERLATTAGSLTVVDASAETLELNRERVGRPDVEYVV